MAAGPPVSLYFRRDLLLFAARFSNKTSTTTEIARRAISITTSLGRFICSFPFAFADAHRDAELRLA
jgi:hypothetical protein